MTEENPLQSIETLVSRNNIAPAREALDAVLARDACNAMALFLLGRTLLFQKKFKTGAAILRRSVAVDPANARALIDLARCELEMGNLPEAQDLAAKAFEISPDLFEVVLGHGQIMVMAGRHQLGRDSLNKAATLDKDSPWPHLGLSLSYFLECDVINGFREYVWRKKLPPLVPPKELPFPSGDLSRKKIIVYEEQGIGDSIHFLRYLPVLLATGASVSLQINTKLWPVIPRHKRLELANGRPHGDSVMALLDLPVLFGAKEGRVPNNIPYLRAPDKKTLRSPAPGTRIRIGICWGGNDSHANDHQRSMPVEMFMDLAALPGVELISLQKGRKSAELAECGGDYLVTDMALDLGDFGDTAALLTELDLLITVDTSVAHLAGALGLPVWCLLPQIPDWRWGGNGEVTPWYPSMRLFRQKKLGDWETCFAGVVQELKRLIKPRAPAPNLPHNELGQGQEVMTQGLAALKDGHWRIALTLMVRCRTLLGDNATLWGNIGIGLRNLGHARAALAAYRRAEAAGGLSSSLATNMANALLDLNRLAEAENLHAYAANSDPNSALTAYNLGYNYKLQNRIEDANTYINKALAFDAGYLDAQWEASQLALGTGHYEDGWRHYECRWRMPEAGSKQHPYPEWQGEDIAGKTLLVYAEQGFGDAIFAARFLPLLRTAKARIILEVRPELIQLFLRHGLADRVVARGAQINETVHVQVAMMSVAGWVKATPSGNAYLTANPVLVDVLAGHFHRPGFKVGFVWSGSKTFKGNKFRAGVLEDFMPLLTIPQVQLYSLQMGGAEVKLQSFSRKGLVVDLSEVLVDFEFSAAALSHLDLVIMTDSSVAHLAGALGRPVWIVMGPRPYWVWGYQGSTTPWYESVRLFRPRKTHAQTMDMVMKALRKHLAGGPHS